MHSIRSPGSRLKSVKAASTARAPIIKMRCGSCLALLVLLACGCSGGGAFGVEDTAVEGIPPAAVPAEPLLSEIKSASQLADQPGQEEPPFLSGPFVYGASRQGRLLLVYRLGNGPRARALIGGIHGGYEWNTTALTNMLLLYMESNPELVSEQLSIYVIPMANPDGTAAGADAVHGRTNAVGVDLNRNWDYEWSEIAYHGRTQLSGGSAPFSEPETVALRDFLLAQRVEAVIFYHSAAGMVFPGVGRQTSRSAELGRLMAQASGYLYMRDGLPGQIMTGNAVDWLSVHGISAVEVELSTHQDVDWQRNLAALLAFLSWDLP
jgi:hypothetical protein